MTDYDDISWNDYKLVYIKRFIKPIYKKFFAMVPVLLLNNVAFAADSVATC